MEISFPEDQFNFLCWLLNEISDQIKFDDEELATLLNDLVKTINDRLEIEHIINGSAFPHDS